MQYDVDNLTGSKPKSDWTQFVYYNGWYDLIRSWHIQNIMNGMTTRI